MSGAGGSDRLGMVGKVVRWLTGTWILRDPAPGGTVGGSQTRSADSYFEDAAGHLARFSACLVGSVMFWSLGAGLLFAQTQNQPIQLMLLYSVYALGALLVLGLSGAMGGGILGFLFGLPRASDVTPLPAAPMGPDSGSSGVVQSNGRSYRLSDNLLQITDWLTKIIVGVGLVEAQAMYGGLSTRLKIFSEGILGGKFGADLVVSAVFVASVVLGFIFFYLLTTAIVAPMLARTDKGLNSVDALLDEEAADQTLASMATIKDRVQLAQSGDAGTRQKSIAAASRIGDIPWEEVERRKDLKLLLAWATSKASSADFSDAAKAYRAYLAQVPFPSRIILQEAKRIYTQAESASDKGGSNFTTTNVSEQDRLRGLRNEVVGLLYKDSGFRDVLQKLLDDKNVDADGTGALSMYRAFALGQEYRAVTTGSTGATGWDKTKIKATALADIKQAVARGQSKDWIRYVWDRADTSKPNGPEREDDLEIFCDDRDFQEYFGVVPAKPA